jgi:hypothetical protein
MAYGLRITNDDSELLIDSDYVNPTFVQKLEFNSTPTSTETGTNGPSFGGMANLHANYYKRTYTTTTAPLNTGTYIVLFTLPDNGDIDVWYNFPTSVMDVNRTLTCEVYTNMLGAALSFTLPTAYIFAVDTGGLSTLYSTGPALRMYNNSSEKTFDSNFTQLIPYSLTDSFAGAQYGAPTSTALIQPANPIYLLPKAYAIYEFNSEISGYKDQLMYETMYRRVGPTIYSKQLSTYWLRVSGTRSSFYQFTAGNNSNLSILVADGNIYQGASGGSVNTINPTYTLSSNYASVNETNNKTFTITLTTTLVTNGTVIYYTVTGINGADLSSGGLTGSFTIQNNTATVSFTVATDTVTEGIETFLLTLNGINQSVSVNILDTSRSPYAWSAPSSTSINEDTTTSYIDFNSLYNDSTYPVTFDLVGSSTGGSFEIIFAYPDVTLNPTIPSGASYTRVYLNIRADMITEGPKTFRVKATVEGNSYYTSDITINDTTTSSVTADNIWTAVTDNTVTVTVTGGSGKTVYLYSDNTAVIDVKAGSTSSWTLSSSSFTTTTTYQAKSVTADTQVGLYLKNGAEFIASKFITVKPAAPTYSWATPASINEGSTGSLQFNYNNLAAGKVIYFALNYGTNVNSSDITLNTTSYTVPAYGSGSVSVSYSTSADVSTEGAEYFTLSATVDSTVTTSTNITINDTSRSRSYSINTANTWAEGILFNPITISATNASGVTLYLTSSDSSIAYVRVPYATSWTVDSDTYSNTTYFSAANVFNSTNVTLYLRVGSASGPSVAEVTITITDANAQYSWAASPTSIDEGASSSLVFNYSEAAGVYFSFFAVSPTGSLLDGSGDVSISTTDFLVGGTDAAGTVTVSYSAYADQITEGTEYFRLAAYANGAYYYSNNISIIDTSLTPTYGITAASPTWNENTTQSTTITLTSVSGYTYYPTSNNAAVVCQTTNFTVTSNNFTTTLYWNVGAVSADTTVNLYLRRSRSSGSIDAQTSVTVKDILAAGTAIGAAFCVSYGSAPYTLRQVRADGSGGTYNDDTSNSPTCGYTPPATYSLARSTSSVTESGSFSITFSTNQTGSFGYTITGVSSADINGASLTGTVSNGDVLYYSLFADQITENTETFTITLNNQQATTSVTISDTSIYPAYGTLVTAYCLSYSSPYTYRQVYNNGSGGTYNVDTNNSTTCGYVAPTPPGTYLSQYCAGGNGYSLYYRYADGNYSYYDVLQANNSATCGYVAPSYAIYNTWSDLANGAAAQFYVQSNAANGVTLTPSISGAGAGRVSISPTSSYISGNGYVNTFFTVTATLPTSNVAAQSVTISVAGQSFSFTVQAYAPVAVAPTVIGIRVGGDETVYAGQQSYAIITFSGPITSTTYLQVEFNLGAYTPYYGTPVNNYGGGTSASQSHEFYLGASEGIVYTPTNPGNFNTILRLRARSINSSGTAITSYTSSTLFSYKATGTIPA